MRQKDGKRKTLKRSAGVSGDVDSLYDRVADILDRARANVVRSVNSEMVLAYWHIGREIVQLVQGGDDRAEYGKGLIDEFSSRLTKRYGNGFSTTNLRYFRTFYQVYTDREPEIRHMAGGESSGARIRHTAGGVLEDLSLVVDQADLPREVPPFPPCKWLDLQDLQRLGRRQREDIRRGDTMPSHAAPGGAAGTRRAAATQD